MDLFHKFTLRSLLNQTFDKFEIWVMCGQNNREVTAAYEWHPRCMVMYDKGQRRLEEMDARYLAITRIDSDDLFHKDAINEVSENVVATDKPEVLIFRKNLVWDRNNKYIARHIRKSPPFFTRIYPKDLYKDWKFFEGTHFKEHGRVAKRARELSENKVCVVKHEQNASLRGKNPDMFNSMSEIRRIHRDKFVTANRDNMIKILEDFAINEADV